MKTKPKFTFEKPGSFSHQRTQWYNEYTLAAGFSAEVIGLLGVCSYGGYCIDTQINTNPWGCIAGFIVGFIGALYRAMWIVRTFQKYERTSNHESAIIPSQTQNNDHN